MMITINKNTRIYHEPTALKGAAYAAENLSHDMELIFGSRPEKLYPGESCDAAVIYGTNGKSPILDKLDSEGKISLKEITGKWEVYSIHIVDNPAPNISKAIVVAGSDKRGTIYGLYHLSELMGVSPLVNWNHVYPQKRSEIVFDDSINTVSKTPSVKYRGFFINDEWPAFGSWANKHFGGINAKCYEAVFELLLRLKGNYLWPAMWGSCFNLDGPGLESAVLADELGVVMSMSHHEPCNRSGNEYGMMRGKDSPYGDAWSFIDNPEGITAFWRDGLERNKDFENVITMGMRGENDTAIMANATLEDNIQMLRDVLHTQNELIKETVNGDLEKVPRQIVLFTEVEEFFYGSSEIKGLIGDPELEGVTLMLSDNNFGAARTLPSEKMRSHKGGYGMYYHQDMHGGPHSYQWIGSTFLPKLWEQMTMAYAYGVSEIWVTNIGDIGTQEFGLSYFLDLAYNIDKWGGETPAVTDKYTEEWVRQNFQGFFSQEQLGDICRVITDYTRLLARRKHEKVNEWTYHPVNFGEADEAIKICESILNTCHKLKSCCPQEYLGAYISLIHYPACGTANLIKMWVLASKNRLYASQNRLAANTAADRIKSAIQTDYELTEEYHSIDGGKYDGFGLSEHIGFVTWDDCNNQYPVMRYIHPANTRRMIIAKINDEGYVTGLPTSDRRLIWNDGLRQDICCIDFDIACAGKSPMSFKIMTDSDWISFSETEGDVELTKRIRLYIDKSRFTGRVNGCFTVIGIGFNAKANIFIEAENNPDLPKDVFIENDGYICMKAINYQSRKDTPDGGFRILTPCTRELSAIKAYPVTTDFMEVKDKPYAEYHFSAEENGVYNIRFYMEASTPVIFERRQFICFDVNGGEIQTVNTVSQPERQFFASAQANKEATDHIKLTDWEVECKKGINILRFYAASPAIVLEKIVLWRKGSKLKDSYMGPCESYLSK